MIRERGELVNKPFDLDNIDFIEKIEKEIFIKKINTDKKLDIFGEEIIIFKYKLIFGNLKIKDLYMFRKVNFGFFGLLRIGCFLIK
jgi:hypothetical protein